MKIFNNFYQVDFLMSVKLLLAVLKLSFSSVTTAIFELYLYLETLFDL